MEFNPQNDTYACHMPFKKETCWTTCRFPPHPSLVHFYSRKRSSALANLLKHEGNSRRDRSRIGAEQEHTRIKNGHWPIHSAHPFTSHMRQEDSQMSAQEGCVSALSDAPMPSSPAGTHHSDSEPEALRGDGPEGSSDESEGQSSLPAAREETKKDEDENKRLRALTDPSLGLDDSKEEGEEVKAMHGREKLKRHRVDVAGQAWVPEIWGQEELLKDWVDCSVFEASFLPARIMLAKAALAEEGRRARPGGLRIENRC